MQASSSDCWPSNLQLEYSGPPHAKSSSWQPVEAHPRLAYHRCESPSCAVGSRLLRRRYCEDLLSILSTVPERFPTGEGPSSSYLSDGSVRLSADRRCGAAGVGFRQRSRPRDSGTIHNLSLSQVATWQLTSSVEALFTEKRIYPIPISKPFCG